ncbi:MAG TPA: hypothetical protein VMV45_14550, partial [Casimicrobiaceae bacterium]|nr:hypothetical protein [Casimicrobiaceae bacterium]
RITFSRGPCNDFTTDVPVVIAGSNGNPVFVLPEAGPLLYVTLPDGWYLVSAESDGVVQTQQITLTRGKARDVAFHWSGAAAASARHEL